MHVPETAERTTVWGRPHLKLLLPGELAGSLSLCDLATKLNGLEPPNQFLRSDLGEYVTVRLTLSDVRGRTGEPSCLDTLNRDISIGNAKTWATDWHEIVDGERRLSELLGTDGLARYPLLEIGVQQTRSFVSPGL